MTGKHAAGVQSSLTTFAKWIVRSIWMFVSRIVFDSIFSRFRQDPALARDFTKEEFIRLRVSAMTAAPELKDDDLGEKMTTVAICMQLDLQKASKDSPGLVCVCKRCRYTSK